MALLRRTLYRDPACLFALTDPTTEFDQQRYIIVRLGRPGGFNPPTAATATTEAGAMEVNYVRAWALPSGTTTGGTHANPAGN